MAAVAGVPRAGRPVPTRDSARTPPDGHAVMHDVRDHHELGAHHARYRADELGSQNRAVLPSVEHRRHKGLNNRAENSHRPTRRRERVLQRFKSPAHAQQFLAPFGPISDHFRPRRHLLPAPDYHHLLQTRFAEWRAVTGLAAA